VIYFDVSGMRSRYFACQLHQNKAKEKDHTSSESASELSLRMRTRPAVTVLMEWCVTGCTASLEHSLAAPASLLKSL